MYDVFIFASQKKNNDSLEDVNIFASQKKIMVQWMMYLCLRRKKKSDSLMDVEAFCIMNQSNISLKINNHFRIIKQEIISLKDDIYFSSQKNKVTREIMNIQREANEIYFTV